MQATMSSRVEFLGNCYWQYCNTVAATILFLLLSQCTMNVLTLNSTVACMFSHIHFEWLGAENLILNSVLTAAQCGRQL